MIHVMMPLQFIIKKEREKEITLQRNIVKFLNDNLLIRVKLLIISHLATL